MKVVRLNNEELNDAISHGLPIQRLENVNSCSLKWMKWTRVDTTM